MSFPSKCRNCDYLLAENYGSTAENRCVLCLAAEQAARREIASSDVSHAEAVAKRSVRVLSGRPMELSLSA